MKKGGAAMPSRQRLMQAMTVGAGAILFSGLRSRRVAAELESDAGPTVTGPITCTCRWTRRSGCSRIVAACFLASAFTSSAAIAGERVEPRTPNCEGLATLALPNARVILARTVKGGQVTVPAFQSLVGAQSKIPDRTITNLPPFCQVRVVVKPAINVEIWLPLEKWNGKLLGVAPGGTGGTIIYEEGAGNMSLGLAAGLRRGYAMMSTDLGHVASDQTWWNDFGRLIDLGYRGAHEMAIKGKEVTAAFYRQRPTRTYYNGCSGGGRVGLMEAQRYPDDFDGIIVGDPGYNWTNLMAFEIWGARAVTETPKANLSTAKIAMLAAAVVAACDADDGVRDGIVSNPLTCRFDPAVLQCKAADGPDCLTAEQVGAVRKLYDGVTYPDGRLISHGSERGSEASWAVYAGITDVNTQGGASARSFIRRTIMEDPGFDFKTFDFNYDMDLIRDKAAAIMDATSPDLSGFKARGGKMIHYHGWADGAARAMIDYYESVVSKVGMRSTVEDFYRLYLAPGMGHCGGGVGPNQFEPLTALEAWSEKGIAPDAMIATRVDPKSGKPDMTRPLCPWPKAAHYGGVGDPMVAANFYCADPAK
jgi:feruloyl esterase